LDRSQEKLLDRILKLKQKGQYQKARTAMDDATLESTDTPELAAEAVGLSFQLDDWQAALATLETHLQHHSLEALCGGANRSRFLELIHEHGGFAGGLTHALMSGRDFEGIAAWMRLSDDYDQRWLIRQWAQTAKERAHEPLRAAMLHAATGVGLFLIDDWDSAWNQWEIALRIEPRLLKKLMGFCQQPGRLESTKLSHRLLLIRLIAASGKKNETLSLLKAVGLESPENAVQVLGVIPDLFNESVNDKDVVTLRFSLAMSLHDAEILTSVIAGMSALPESDLFRYKKLAMSKIEDQAIKRRVMLAFVKLYFDREEWESAGVLLEQLYLESPHQEIVNLMEQVLDRYPIMSQLHFTAGKYYLELENYDKAVYHLGTIQQVEEYEAEIASLLEIHSSRVYESSLAEMLLGMLDPSSHKAGLVAYWILDNEREELEKHLSLWAQPKLSDQSSPFWYLALINALVGLGKLEETMPLLAHFVEQFPSLSAEVLRPAEVLAESLRGDTTALTRAIEDNLDRLQPRNAWSGLRMRFIETTQKFKQQQSTARPAPDVPEPKGRVTPEMKNHFGHFKALLDSGSWQAAADLAIKVSTEIPQSAPNVLRYLDALSRQFPQQSIWVRTMLEILNSLGQYAKAVQLGSQALAGPGNQADLPELYQLLSESYKGQGNRIESFRFLCLASRLPRLYEKNATALAERVLPELSQYLKDVVQLVLINEDQETWEILMKSWYQHRPEDLDQLIKAQKSFTNQLGSTRSVLDLAYWHLQAGQAEEVTQTLNQLDLSDPEILESLTRIADLTALKFPDDPKPKFLLGKYYLVQGEIDKAVDTFRELAGQAPNLAETVYHHLRTFLRQNPLSTNKVRLYGLLIRFALDYGTPLASVKLLDEYGRQDRAGALNLADGVYRVLLRKKGHLEAIFEYLKMLFGWNDFPRLLRCHERGDLGTHMADERARWFEEIRSTHPELADEANLALARLFAETHDFDRSRHTLSLLEGAAVRRASLAIYQKLCDRFPGKADLWREAAWASFPLDDALSIHFFTKLAEEEDLEIRAEAFALLTDLGHKPDRAALREVSADEDQVLGALHKAFHRAREAELAYYSHSEEPVPARLLIWLIETDREKLAEPMIARLDPEATAGREEITALLMWWSGHRTLAARKLSGTNASTAHKRSFLVEAGMIERAIALAGNDRIPTRIREMFLSTYRQPALIRPTVDHIRLLQRRLTLGANR